ncbi:hypothetical protein PsorP6_016927 [Peronosclerospora sorghi]|uniref:Uncharacterized protein n=1 Tax=Peronosclerospora sorghi TaxID=230839 RepID=A0ACC0WDJ7_9STRA|nr:hypothetical protein PsorP6_016927 [Peronosclerospora sorghi]
MQSAFQTQSRCKTRPNDERVNTSLSFAVAGAAALGAGLKVQADNVTQTRATIEPIDHKWHLFSQIGSGAFGTVRLGMHKASGEVAAVKIVPLENPGEKRSFPALERELSALKLVKALGGHKSIIDLRDVYVEGRKLFMVTELARGGELFEQIVTYGSFSEAKARDVTRELASALSFLHRHGLVHKDVKPENILFTTRNDDRNNCHDQKSTNLVKLADFGSAGPAGDMSNLEDIGTPAYQPPELLTSGTCTSACDMWALGCVLYIMLSGSHPFDLDGLSLDSKVEHRIKTEPINFNFRAWDNVSSDAKDVVSKLLAKDPALRLTADETLNHPWMNANAKRTDAAAANVHRPSPLPAGQPIPMGSV